MKRPEITSELVTAVAIEFCKKHNYQENEAADIVSVFGSNHHLDGYQLARALDEDRGWAISVHDVETLDGFSEAVCQAHKQVCIAWARDNNIQPPLPVGAMTTVGEITGIYSSDAACYLIRAHGETNPSRRSIVKFEDVRAAPGQVVLPQEPALAYLPERPPSGG